MLAAGHSPAQVAQLLGVSEQTYHLWRDQFGGLKHGEARRLRELVIQNARPKNLVADRAIDLSILKQASTYLGEHRAPRAGGAL